MGVDPVSPARPAWLIASHLLFAAFGAYRGVYWDIVDSYQQPADPYNAQEWFVIRQVQRESLCAQLRHWGWPVPKLPDDEIGPLGAMGFGVFPPDPE
jgi:hypothetical protein